MSMKLFELKQEREHALAKSEAIISTAERAGRAFTKEEQMDLNTLNTTLSVLAPKIARLEGNNTLSVAFGVEGGMLRATSADHGDRSVRPATAGKRLSADYPDAFYSFIKSAGTHVEAALYEGSDGSGGYAVPIVVDSQIVPLAPSEMAVRQLATVVPTTSDIKVPQKGSFGTASAKAENAAFTESDPTLTQFTLSAFLNGIQQTISWELAQDVPSFQAFAIDDMILACQMREENLYVNGTGTGQAQGLSATSATRAVRPKSRTKTATW